MIVSTTPGFAGVWLIPRLSSFVASHPGIDVRISAVNTLADLARDGVDVAVRYQAVDALPAAATRLFGETVTPVCSPRLLREAGAALEVPADLRRQTLLRMEPDGSNELQDGDSGCRQCTWPTSSRPAFCTSRRTTSWSRRPSPGRASRSAAGR